MNDLEITQAISRVLSKYTKTAPQAQEHNAPALSTAPDRNSIEAIVASVLASRVSAEPTAALSNCDGAFATMDEAITAVQHAQIQYRHGSMQDRARFVAGIRQLFSTGRGVAGHFQNGRGRTGIGNYADKLIKNRVAAQKMPGRQLPTTLVIFGEVAAVNEAMRNIEDDASTF